MPEDRRSRLVLLVLLILLCVSGCDERTPTTPSPPSPVTILELSLMPATVVAGATSDGRVTLSGPAPSGGTEVRLSSSDAVAVIPGSMTVSVGSITGTFTIRTLVVAADTMTTISGLAGGEKREATLRVTAPVARPPTLQALEVQPSVIKGGENAQGTVRLTGAAPAGGMLVNLRSSNAAATVPSGVRIPADGITATFTVTTSAVSLDTQFEITASLGDQTRTALIRVTP